MAVTLDFSISSPHALNVTALRYVNIIYEKRGSVGVLTYNRPQVLNAWNMELITEKVHALQQAEADESVRALVITGAGKAFCVGADVKQLANATPHWMAGYNRRIIDLFRQMERMGKPIIAAVNGYANLEMYQACDMVLAADDAKVGLPEINIGVCPGAGIAIRLTRWTGRFKAKEILFTGDWIPAQEAQKLGLVNRVVSRDRLMEEAFKLAQTLAEKAPLALKAAKMDVNIGADMDPERGVEYQLLEFLALFNTEDQKEGMRAFLEKRKPFFRGK